MLVFFMLSTRMFYSTVLKKIPNTLDYDIPNEKGLLVSAVLLALAYLLIHFLVQSNFI